MRIATMLLISLDTVFAYSIKWTINMSTIAQLSPDELYQYVFRIFSRLSRCSRLKPLTL
jgi:hypothetical protein